MEDYQYLFKIVLIGNSCVGKSCLVRRFTEDCFSEGRCPTIGVDFMIKTVEIDKDVVKLQIWDTAGQERFKSITQSYYRSADALIVVYDVTNAVSFDSVPQWLREVEQYAREGLPVYLVGNKSDLISDREVSTSSGVDLSVMNQLHFLETSAKASDNVDQLFTDLAKILRLNAMKAGKAPAGGMSDSFVLRNTGTTNVSNSSCCWLM